MGRKPKNENKDIRNPIGEETDSNKMSEDDKIRAATGKQRRLDCSHYQRMPEYQERQLFYAHDEHGELDTWLGLGAEPVARRSKSTKIWPGINDQGGTEWEYTVVDTDKSGNPIKAYLLHMDKDDYKKYKIQPKIDRNAEIEKRLNIGVANVEGNEMPGQHVKGLKTYAPQVGGGKVGLRTEITHDV